MCSRRVVDVVITYSRAQTHTASFSVDTRQPERRRSCRGRGLSTSGKDQRSLVVRGTHISFRRYSSVQKVCGRGSQVMKLAENVNSSFLFLTLCPAGLQDYLTPSRVYVGVYNSGQKVGEVRVLVDHVCWKVKSGFVSLIFSPAGSLTFQLIFCNVEYAVKSRRVPSFRVKPFHVDFSSS